MEHSLKNEKGTAIVEATLLLPFCIIMVLALYYAAIFMCQKANLQANLENALIYYKNVSSDTYVEASSTMAYEEIDGTYAAVGNSYGEPQYEFPYRFLGMKFDKAGFESFFHSMCGNMFFDDGSNVTVNATAKNYIVYREIRATASQTVKPAISLSMVGVKDSLEISCTATAVVTDGDEFIRNTDFVIDIVEHTKLGEKASDLVDKAKGIYDKFKEKFKV